MGFCYVYLSCETSVRRLSAAILAQGIVDKLLRTHVPLPLAALGITLDGEMAAPDAAKVPTPMMNGMKFLL